MKHIYRVGIALFSCFFLSTANISAQSLKDLFSKENVTNIIKEVAGHKTFNIEGTWNYKGTACEFESDNLLKKAGGAVASSALENKLDEYCSKAGIKPGSFNYTFNADSTFTNTYGKKTFRGKYSISNDTVTLKYFGLVAFHAKANSSNDNLVLLFDADKLLKLMSTLGNMSKSTAMQTLSNLADQYDGARLGFDLSKQ